MRCVLYRLVGELAPVFGRSSTEPLSPAACRCPRNGRPARKRRPSSDQCGSQLRRRRAINAPCYAAVISSAASAFVVVDVGGGGGGGGGGHCAALPVNFGTAPTTSSISWSASQPVRLPTIAQSGWVRLGTLERLGTSA